MDARKKGDLIEGFRVLSEVGRGAASVIYLVQDPKTKQIWALKHVEKAKPKDQRFLDQAESESAIAAKLDHSAIRKIFRVIKKKRQFLSVKELYLVMEYVDGVSLDKHLPKSLELAVDIFHQLADAMAHMHDRGFIHADMKPNNVVVSEAGIVKIIDLGQSCKSGTIKPRIQGTPDYIAPEQVHRREITPKTDIYNLGATMYWVLTGSHIPTAMPRENASLVSSLDDQFIEKPTPVSELNPKIDRRFNDLIMHCVEVDPDKRPISMDAVADKLNLILGIVRANNELRSGDGSSPAA